MASLLDTLRKNLSQVGAAPAAAGEETGQVQALVSAKSGQVGARPAPRGRSIIEAAAQQQTQEQLTGLKEQAAAQSIGTTQAFAEQEQRQRAAEADITGKKEAGRLEARIKTENLLQDLEMNRGRMSAKEQQAKTELLTATMRLGNKDYTDRLRLEGARNRLDDRLQFEQALAKSIMSENLDIFKKGLVDRQAREASDREYQKELARMNAQDVLAQYRAAARQGATQAQIGAIAETAKTGAAAYGQYSKESKAGAYDEGYQSYLESGRDDTPKSYASWKRERDLGSAPENQTSWNRMS
jgi:hypothetical protein